MCVCDDEEEEEKRTKRKSEKKKHESNRCHAIVHRQIMLYTLNDTSQVTNIFFHLLFSRAPIRELCAIR